MFLRSSMTDIKRSSASIVEQIDFSILFFSGILLGFEIILKAKTYDTKASYSQSHYSKQYRAYTNFFLKCAQMIKISQFQM